MKQQAVRFSDHSLFMDRGTRYMLNYSELSCREFIEILASKEPVPGGGGASALAGGIGTALGNMVGSLTVGKKKYADAEPEILSLKKRCDTLQEAFLDLIAKDAEVFEPLSAAYRLPRETLEQQEIKEKVMEEALNQASLVPLEIMERCCEAIDVIAVFAEKGSVMAISDAGVGAALCKAALQGASLNIFINTKAMKNRERAEEYNKRADTMLARYCERADQVYESVCGRLRSQ